MKHNALPLTQPTILQPCYRRRQGCDGRGAGGLLQSVSASAAWALDWQRRFCVRVMACYAGRRGKVQRLTGTSPGRKIDDEPGASADVG